MASAVDRAFLIERARVGKGPIAACSMVSYTSTRMLDALPRIEFEVASAKSSSPVWRTLGRRME